MRVLRLRHGVLGLLLASWVVRGVFIAAMPARVHSADVDHWVVVAQQLRAGANPYATTTFLNWPPLWLGCIWLIDHLSRTFDISFFLALRLFLVVVESALIVAVHRLLLACGVRSATRIVLFGLCLNPVSILLVCQHGNFDVVVGLFVVLGVAALAFDRGRREWVLACAAFGIAALAKTVPLALAPLLVPGARRRGQRGRALGAVLFLGPAVVGVAVLLALATHAVIDNVVLYRSSTGYFGISGLLWAVGLDHVSAAYTKGLFPLIAVAAFVFGCVLLWRGALDRRRVVLLAALILLTIPTVGPGYAPQYAYWWLPLFVLSYPLFDTTWRRALVVFYVVVVSTYVVEYALIPTQGAFLAALFTHSDTIARMSDHLADRGPQTVLRLPLFVTSLAVLALGVQRLLRPYGVDDTATAAAEIESAGELRLGRSEAH
jgi:hypothetical protein